MKTAELSIETLQARREWQDILKSDEREKLTTQITVPARISFKYEGEIKKKLYRQTKAKRIQHHQTSSPTTAK